MKTNVSPGRERLQWQDLAKCLEADPEIFFPERGGGAEAARAICAQCVVRTACLRYALGNREQYGIWGGKGYRERRRTKRDETSAKVVAA